MSPVAMSSAANKLVVPLRSWSWVQRAARGPGRMGSIGAVRSRTWICNFSSIVRTTAFSGGSRYNPVRHRVKEGRSRPAEPRMRAEQLTPVKVQQLLKVQVLQRPLKPKRTEPTT